MPGKYQVFDREGNLLSSTDLQVSEVEKELRADAEQLKALVTLAQRPERDWTNQDVVRAVRLLLRKELQRELREEPLI